MPLTNIKQLKLLLGSEPSSGFPSHSGQNLTSWLWPAKTQVTWLLLTDLTSLSMFFSPLRLLLCGLWLRLGNPRLPSCSGSSHSYSLCGKHSSYWSAYGSQPPFIPCFFSNVTSAVTKSRLIKMEYEKIKIIPDKSGKRRQRNRNRRDQQKTDNKW